MVANNFLQTDKIKAIYAKIVKNYPATFLQKLYHNQFIITEEKKDYRRGTSERRMIKRQYFFRCQLDNNEIR